MGLQLRNRPNWHVYCKNRTLSLRIASKKAPGEFHAELAIFGIKFTDEPGITDSKPEFLRENREIKRPTAEISLINFANRPTFPQISTDILLVEGWITLASLVVIRSPATGKTTANGASTHRWAGGEGVLHCGIGRYAQFLVVML